MFVNITEAPLSLLNLDMYMMDCSRTFLFVAHAECTASLKGNRTAEDEALERPSGSHSCDPSWTRVVG